MKQKYLLLILLAIIISTTSLSVLAVTPNLELTPPTQSVGIGNQATVNILVEDVTDLKGASITLNFDASKLQYVSSADGGFIPGAFLAPPTVNNTAGTVLLDLASLSSSASGTGTVMTVVLERIATGDTNVTFGSTTLRDKDNITITHTKGNGCLITFCIGDFGGPDGFPDNHVDFEDLMIFALAYGSCEGDDNWNSICDLYPDGKIEFEDLMIFAMHYGDDCGCTLPSAPSLSDPGTSLPSPANYTVSWSSVTEATSYVLQESTSPDFSGAISYPVPGTSKEFSHAVPGTTTYYYRVAAVNDCGQGSWSNVEDIEIIPPDSGNKIFLESGGTLNGTSINTSDPVLTVNTGESITGTLNVQATYTGTPGNVVPFGYTPSWGSHSSSYITVDGWIPVGTSPYTVPINLTAPTTPGTYYLIFASNAEMNLGWTMSQTNWTTGTMSWDDGNDIADLTEPELQDSLSTGYLYLDMLVGSTYNKSNYGIAYVKIEVNEICISPPVSEVSALARTYHLTMSKIQSKIDKLIEAGDIHRSYPLLEPKRTTKGDVVYEVDVEWAEYAGADGYKIYRSVSGGSYVLIAEGNVDPGYGYYHFADTTVTAGSTYSYYVTAYGTGWETCASQSVSSTPLPSCSLISPTNGTTISNPNPAFSWFPVGVSSYPYGAISSGESDLWVYDDTAGSTAWWLFMNNMTTSSGTYDQDGQATALISGHSYTWDSWGYGYDSSGSLIAISESEDWVFDYGDNYTLTTSVTPSGSGSVTLSPSGGTYVPGTVVTLTANPNTNYNFDYWSGDASGTSTSTTITMNSNKSVIAHFEGQTYTLTTSITPTGSGSVTLSPSGGTYVPGTVVTLTANPATDYRFDHWGGSITGTTNPTTITMNGDKSVTAYFVYDPVQYTLTTSVSPSGTGSVSLSPSGGTYAAGTVVTLTANPATDYRFDHWGGSITGTTNPTTITMNGDKSVTAYFVYDPVQYTLTTSAIPSSYGYVTLDPSGGTYAAGTVVTVTAHTNSSIYKLDYWSGDASGSSNPVTITMDRNKNVTAHFRLKHYSLTTSVSPSGSGTVSPSGGTYDTGTVVTLTADANTYYKFDHWGNDASGTSNPTTITMDGNKNVIAYFVPIQYTLTTSANPSSYGYVNPSTTGGSYDAGTVVTISAFPYTGYKLDHWSGDASGSSNPVYVTMDRNKIVTANFVPKQYTLTTSVSPSGSGYVTLSPSGGTYDLGTSVTLTAHEYSKYEFCFWDTGTVCIDQNPTTITMNEDKTMTAVYRQYRLLGVGITDYPGDPDSLPGAIENAISIKALYNHHKYAFAFNDFLENSNATESNILAAIDNQLAAQAGPNDISYFYYAGHGGGDTGYAWLGCYSGSITVAELESHLSNVEGTVVVLLDTCHSGEFIGREVNEQDFYLEEFNDEVISIFSSETLYRDNLAQPKFQVLTSCWSYQVSTYIDPPFMDPYGYFTAHYRAGCGYATFSYPCPANTDSNPAVSLHEAYVYIRDNMASLIPQDVQIYPYGSSFTIMEY